MKYVLLICSFVILFLGCDVIEKDSDFTPLVPENTPFIVGVLEATEDTVHHYPEVYVGTVSNPEGFEAELVWTTEGIWWPIVNTLVTRPVTRMDLKRIPDINAKVSITGPIGKPNERTVQFSHEGNGVYGDVQYQLPLEASETYQLSIKMNDGRRYKAATTIPGMFEWNVPDSDKIELKLRKLQSDGTWYEEGKKRAAYPFTVDKNVGFIVGKANSEYDGDGTFGSSDQFFYGEQSNFLRSGASYSVYDAFDFPEKHEYGIGWYQGENNPLRDSKKWWLTVSQLNKELSNFYYGVYRYIGGESGGRWDRQDSARIEVQRERDGNYLFDYMSNIKEIGENGEVLPKAESDAFGVFGGYSAAYRNLTVIPQRSWDPDTLNWGNQGN